jgi:carbon storage regulator
MLVLTRTTGKTVVIDTGREIIEVTYLGIGERGQAKLGFTAPRHVSVDREEIAKSKAANTKESSHG